MNEQLDAALSIEIAQRTNSKAQAPFDNAYQAAIATDATYVQGFLVKFGEPYKPIEHSWIVLNGQIVDPTLPYLNNTKQLYYFPAQHLSVKQVKAAVEEAIEDYPEDDPLPIYGAAPYEYYGDVMLGGAEYAAAYREAEAKCRDLNKPKTDN